MATATLHNAVFKESHGVFKKRDSQVKGLPQVQATLSSIIMPIGET